MRRTDMLAKISQTSLTEAYFHEIESPVVPMVTHSARFDKIAHSGHNGPLAVHYLIKQCIEYIQAASFGVGQ